MGWCLKCSKQIFEISFEQILNLLYFWVTGGTISSAQVVSCKISYKQLIKKLLAMLQSPVFLVSDICRL